MGVRRAMYCDKGQNLTLIHLYRLTGSQIICHNDRWLHGTPVNLLLPDRLRTSRLEISLTSAERACIYSSSMLANISANYHRSLPPHTLHSLLRSESCCEWHPDNVILEHHLMHLEMAALTSPTSCRAFSYNCASCVIVRSLAASSRFSSSSVLSIWILLTRLSFSSNTDRSDRCSLIYGFPIYFPFSTFQTLSCRSSPRGSHGKTSEALRRRYLHPLLLS